MEKLLSVIVPIYNSEQYLVRCVDSILHQQYQNIEIVLVDDGSTDRSGEICDEFVQKDARVITYHNENRGSVAARNFGAGVAKGELLTFVDSDDWIEADMYYELMQQYKEYEADIISSGYIYDNGKKLQGENDLLPQGFYGREAILQKVIPKMMYDAKYGRRAVTPSLCTKIIRKSLFLETMRNIDTQITYGDDAAIAYISIVKASGIVFAGSAWYHYCVHGNSLSTSYDINSLIKIKQFEDYMETSFKDLGIWEQTWYPLKQYVKLFLSPAIEKIYGVEINIPIYEFPFCLIKEGARIVIYGAGMVGKAYYRTFYESGYGTIEGWIDKNYQYLSKSGYCISAPENVKDMEFDCIVIAMENENAADSVKTYLENMGISKEKIVWKKPKRINSRGEKI